MSDLEREKRVTPWIPESNQMRLRRLGKTSEECGELIAVLGRCTIQGVHGINPDTGMTNLEHLTDELADVLAQIECTVEALNLDRTYIDARVRRKMGYMAEWEAMFK